MLDAIQRIVRAECQACGSPKDPEFETIFQLPAHRQRRRRHRPGGGRLRRAFRRQRASRSRRQTVSEDFSNIPDAAGVPYTYWGIGCTDRDAYLAAEKDGRLDDLPTNHSPKFLPPMQPTLRTGTEALVTAALAWLAP